MLPSISTRPDAFIASGVNRGKSAAEVGAIELVFLVHRARKKALAQWAVGTKPIPSSSRVGITSFSGFSVTTSIALERVTG